MSYTSSEHWSRTVTKDNTAVTVFILIKYQYNADNTSITFWYNSDARPMINWSFRHVHQFREDSEYIYGNSAPSL